jgi:myo-inositol-1(or 4)-monophosphatase
MSDAKDPSPHELARIASIAEAAAEEAATFLMGGYRAHVGIEHKKNRSDLVTKFDRDSEALLKRALAPAGVAVVGEETGGAPADLTLYVDPLDGTTNFAHGHPFFCVSIGLVARGVPLFGVVVAPALNLRWKGGRDAPATRDGKTCHVSEVSEIDDALLATGFPSDRRTNPLNNFDAFVAIKQRCQAIRRCGSAAIDLCFVADGTYDGYWERKLQPWDLAGGAAILLAAGGKVSSIDGSALDFARGNIIASNAKLHQPLLDELARVPSTRMH